LFTSSVLFVEPLAQTLRVVLLYSLIS